MIEAWITFGLLFGLFGIVLPLAFLETERLKKESKARMEKDGK